MVDHLLDHRDGLPDRLDQRADPDAADRKERTGEVIRRVMVIGNAGSGKSTAARMIGEKLGLPVYHMDREVYWLPGWVERDKADQVVQIERIVAKDDWVLEGNNSKTFHLREARADLLIWLDIPLWLRLLRVIRRNFRQKGQTRPDMADGCVEKLHMLPGFLHFVVTTNRNSRRKQGAFFARTSLEKHCFRRTSDMHTFVLALEAYGHGSFQASPDLKAKPP